MTSRQNQFKQAYQEVFDLHVQIENLFHNQPINENRLPFLSYFHSNFTMITPDGLLRDLSWLSNWSHNAAGSRPQVKISIENFTGIFCCSDTVIVSYEEFQQITPTKLLRRASTAVFLPTSNTKQPLLWHHLHETWMQ